MYRKIALPLLAFLFVNAALHSQSKNGSISGTVVDRNQQPIADVTISLDRLGVMAVTSSDGVFSMDAPAGSYELTASRVGFASLTLRVSVEADQVRRLPPIILSAGGNQTLHEVRVTGQTEIMKAKEQPFHVNVVDAKQSYNTSSDLNQVLNRTSGVRIREDGGMGSNFSFSLNGFSGRQVKFFLDGIPMDNFGSSLTLNNFPATMAERIEVYKGVLPVSLGTDALGGAINVVTRSNPNYFDVSYGYGSFNTHKGGINGAYTNAKTGLTVRVNAFYNYSDNNYKVTVQPLDLVSGQRGAPREVERFHDAYQSIGGQVEVGVTGKAYADKLLVGAILAENDKDIQTGVTMEQVFGARTARSSSLIPTIKYKKSDLFVDGLDLNFYSAYNRTANRFVDTTRLKFNWLQETIPTSTAEFSRTQLTNNDNEALVTANLAYRLGDHHALSYNYALTDFRRSSSDVEDPDNITFRLPQGLRKQTMGAAWQATYDGFMATAFGKLYVLNAESFENVSSNNVADYQPTSLKRNHTGYGIAAAYFITPDLQVKASYEHTYRLPESIELLGDGLYVRRNSALRPENSNNLNAGARYAVLSGGAHHLAIAGNFIFRYANDYIRQDQLQVQPIDRQYINVGEVRTTGGEAEAQYAWRNMLFASVNATFQNIMDRTEFLTSTNLTGTVVTKNLNYGYRLPNMPYMFGNGNVGFRLQAPGAGGGVIYLNYSINYVEKYYLTPNHIGANNSDMIPQQIAQHLSADYTLHNGKYTLALECRNLTNRKLYDNYLLQNPGRSFFLKLRYFITQ